MKSDVLRAGLSAMYYSGAHKLLAPYAGGTGLIFMLHRVLPGQPRAFAPNRILQITPKFLDAVITQVREAGLDIVSLDEAHERLQRGGDAGRFACFTLDDGYRDNLLNAYPVFKRHGAPFAIYVPSDFPTGKGELWWIALEEVIATNDLLAATLENGAVVFPLRTAAEKWAAYEQIYAWLRRVDEDRQRAFVR
ncbi:MAG: polysaccharide deacetylase family protein, partial [Methyloligellaceae bacterium]